MPAPRDPGTLLAAARLYYLEGQSQAQIASQLQTSRSNVSRMLNEAQRQGIVEIRIHDPAGRDRDLEARLRRCFGLTDALVAQRTRQRARSSVDQVGTLAAQLLTDRVRDSSTVAVSWGHALQAMAWAISTDEEFNAQIVQLVGGMAAVSNEISGHELVRDIATRLGSGYHVLHAPAVLSSIEARDAMLAEPTVAQALTAARNADLAFVGVGTPSQGSSAAILAALQLNPAEEKAFWAAEPVGDIAARYYTVDGEPIGGASDDRILGVSLADISTIPMVVGVASGRSKTLGVLGAVRGGLIHSLVCDDALARSLLALAAKGGS